MTPADMAKTWSSARNYHTWKNSKSYNTSFVTKKKSLPSVKWVWFETHTYKGTSRQKCPRHHLIMGTWERSPVIHLQTVAQAPTMRCRGDVGVSYCHEDPVAGCHLDEPATVLVIGVVYWVVGTSNKTSVAIIVKVAECCIFSIIVVTSFDNKKTRKITFVREYHSELRMKTNLPRDFTAHYN